MPDKKENEARWFTEARELFEAMVTWLSSDNICGLEHGELENQLLVNGNELLRKLLQGYLDRRSDDEIEGDCQGSDGAKRTHLSETIKVLNHHIWDSHGQSHWLRGEKADQSQSIRWRIKLTDRKILPRTIRASCLSSC